MLFAFIAVLEIFTTVLYVFLDTLLLIEVAFWPRHHVRQ